MNCPTCQFTNPTGARFCAQCGTRLTARCPVCAQPVEATQRFCTDCGHAQPGADGAPSGAELGRTPVSYTPRHLAARILADRDSLHGEKKQVTVLFCDMVDSTVLARELGAEAMHDLLSEFFALALAEVHRFEGTVNQFLGDGFMAIFGAPLAAEDHAARAGLAAIAIGDALDRMRTAAAGSSWSRVQVRLSPLGRTAARGRHRPDPAPRSRLPVFRFPDVPDHPRGRVSRETCASIDLADGAGSRHRRRQQIGGESSRILATRRSGERGART